MRANFNQLIKLAPGVDTMLNVNTQHAVEISSGPVDVVRLAFATVALNDLIDNVGLRMRLSLPMDRETQPNRPGPAPIPSSVADSLSNTLASLTHFVHNRPRGGDIVNLYGYEVNPNRLDVFYERHPLVDGQPIGSYMQAGLYATKTKYPRNHKKAGKNMDAVGVVVTASVDMIQDPRTDKLDADAFVGMLAHKIGRDVIALASYDRTAVATNDNFPNVFDDKNLRETFALRQAR